ncbi:MAG: peptidylprolyl isomerase [Candidatus Woesearchaeota archaeon]|nr:peptidylprolyl isomerase [Candidatus Woesearchaeota archaeon]
MAFKKHDFVEIEYTGRLEDGSIFDTTDAEVAKKNRLGNQNSTFAPAVICLGEDHVLKGMEAQIKEVGTFKVKLTPEQAFGKKDPKLLKLMPMKIFVKEKLRPVVGLEVNIDGMYGIVRSVSGGRVIVDFNHPLSGKTVEYDVKVNRQVTDTLEKAKAVFKNEMRIIENILEVKEDKLVIKEEKFPTEVIDNVKKRILELIPEIKDVVKESKAA